MSALPRPLPPETTILAAVSSGLSDSDKSLFIYSELEETFAEAVSVIAEDPVTFSMEIEEETSFEEFFSFEEETIELQVYAPAATPIETVAKMETPIVELKETKTVQTIKKQVIETVQETISAKTETPKETLPMVSKKETLPSTQKEEPKAKAVASAPPDKETVAKQPTKMVQNTHEEKKEKREEKNGKIRLGRTRTREDLPRAFNEFGGYQVGDLTGRGARHMALNGVNVSGRMLLEATGGVLTTISARPASAHTSYGMPHTPRS